MKKSKILKIIAAAAALCICTAMLSGCSKNDETADTTTTTAAASENESSVTLAPDDVNLEDVTTEALGTMREVAEGDVYAINKFTVDPLPANYELVAHSQDEQGKLYVNGVSRVTVMAANYKEDFKDLHEFAETCCASLKFTNMLYQSDTVFGDPIDATVAGFDAVRYDFDITANEFVKENEDDEEEEAVKTPIAWYSSRAYFFYSDNDAYYVIFETERDDWDSTIDGFEEFVANITIDENAENLPVEETTAEVTEETTAASEE